MGVSCEHIFARTYVPTNVWCWGDYDSIVSCPELVVTLNMLHRSSLEGAKGSSIIQVEHT